MNKRIIAFLLSSLFFGAFKPVVAMHGKVLRGVQVLTGGSLIAAGATLSYMANKAIQNPVEGEPMPAIVQEWLRAELKKLNIPNADTVPLLQNERGWAVLKGKVIACSQDQAKSLEYALKTKPNLVSEYNQCRSEYDKCWQNFESYSYVRRMLSQKNLECWNSDRKCDGHRSEIAYCNRVIERSRACVKHECKHYLNQDCQGRAYAFVAIPIMVQAGCSTLAYSFNKLLNIQPPKTVLRTLLRSAVSVGAIVPKAAISFVGGVLYVQHQEREADRFSCEYAESKLELSEQVAEFRESEKAAKIIAIQNFPGLVTIDDKSQDRFVRKFVFIRDMQHPYPGDRAEMAQEYLDKWDAEHSA